MPLTNAARIPKNTTKDYMTNIQSVFRINCVNFITEKTISWWQLFVTLNARKTGNISLLAGSVVWIVKQHKTEASGLHSNENTKQKGLSRFVTDQSNCCIG